MKILVIVLLIFISGFILGAGIERDNKPVEKHKLTMLLSKNGKTDTVKIEIDTFRYSQP